MTAIRRLAVAVLSLLRRVRCVLRANAAPLGPIPPARCVACNGRMDRARPWYPVPGELHVRGTCSSACSVDYFVRAITSGGRS